MRRPRATSGGQTGIRWVFETRSSDRTRCSPHRESAEIEVLQSSHLARSRCQVPKVGVNARPPQRACWAFRGSARRQSSSEGEESRRLHRSRPRAPGYGARSPRVAVARRVRDGLGSHTLLLPFFAMSHGRSHQSRFADQRCEVCTLETREYPPPQTGPKLPLGFQGQAVRYWRRAGMPCPFLGTD